MDYNLQHNAQKQTWRRLSSQAKGLEEICDIDSVSVFTTNAWLFTMVCVSEEINARHNSINILFIKPKMVGCGCEYQVFSIFWIIALWFSNCAKLFFEKIGNSWNKIWALTKRRKTRACPFFFLINSILLHFWYVHLVLTNKWTIN